MYIGKKLLPKNGKHKASGQAIVTLSGKDYCLGPHGTRVSKLAFDQLVAEWPQIGRSSGEANSCEITVVEICAKYFRFAKGYSRKNGKPTGDFPNIRIALRFLRQLYGDTSAAQFRPVALQVLHQKMDRDQSLKEIHQLPNRPHQEDI